MNNENTFMQDFPDIDIMDMSRSTAFNGTSALDFEWNVFEQFFEWHHALSSAPDLSTPLQSPNTSDMIAGCSPILDSESRQQSSLPARTGKPGRPRKDTYERGQSEPYQIYPPAKERRRNQNRASQRTFRMRQKQHVEELERKLKDRNSEFEAIKKSYESLSQKHEKLVQECCRMEIVKFSERNNEL